MIFFRHNTRVQKHHPIHSRYVTSFNQQYFELLNIMKQYSENYPKFPIFYANNRAICVTKPKLLISIWHEYITQKYMTQIMDENIEYFLMQDFDSRAISRRFYVAYCVNKALNYMKNIYPRMTDNDLELVKQKVKKLCIISNLYFNSKMMHDSALHF